MSPLAAFVVFIHETYSTLSGSVFCVSLDPVANSLAITGGEDDKAYVWSITDGEMLFECTGVWE